MIPRSIKRRGGPGNHEGSEGCREVKPVPNKEDGKMDHVVVFDCLLCLEKIELHNRKTCCITITTVITSHHTPSQADLHVLGQQY